MFLETKISYLNLFKTHTPCAHHFYYQNLYKIYTVFYLILIQKINLPLSKSIFCFFFFQKKSWQKFLPKSRRFGNFLKNYKIYVFCDTNASAKTQHAYAYSPVNLCSHTCRVYTLNFQKANFNCIEKFNFNKSFFFNSNIKSKILCFFNNKFKFFLINNFFFFNFFYFFTIKIQTIFMPNANYRILNKILFLTRLNSRALLNLISYNYFLL